MRIGSRVRWAVAASVGVHAVLTVVGVALTRRLPEPPYTTPPRINTQVTFAAARIPEERVPAPVVTAPDPDPPPPEPAPQPVPPAPAPNPPAVQRPPLPRTVSMPGTLPPDLIARIRNFVPEPAPHTDPAVRPSSGVAAAVTRPAARPAHGALAAGQRVVYLLDASGSMGEWGKFDAARDAAVATLALQPATVEVKLVVYATAAEVVTPAVLAARIPAGRGDHLAGLRVALEQSPDFVVWFTDTDDLPTAAVRTAVRRGGKTVKLVVARVGANGVGAPVELR